MATSSSLVTQAQLEIRFGVQTVARYCDDDGDDIADASVVEQILQAGSDEAKGIMLAAWSGAQIEIIADKDAAVREHVLAICADLMAMRRAEFLDANGNTPYSGIRDRAEKRLKEIAKAERRSIGEESAGTSVIITSKVTPDPPRLVFSRTTDSPGGRGGY